MALTLDKVKAKELRAESKGGKSSKSGKAEGQLDSLEDYLPNEE